MNTQNFMIATAGHVDHGKSALVRALTGTDPDRLPEEKARGITIDLGFAELNLVGSDGGNIHAGIVDVPGHENFVRNMIAGVGSIDLALLVVAADDGWMPQTEEHLQILAYLGVERAIIVLTKSDLGRVDVVAGEVRDRLHQTAFAQSPLVATSVRLGTGIPELKQALISALSTLEPQRDIGKPRLFVDRAFGLRGIGTVVTGTLTGGMLSRGQIVVVAPQNREARIRSIQHHGRDSEFASPGMRTALNLPELTIGTSPGGIMRGQVVTAEAFAPRSTIDVMLTRSSRLHEHDPGTRPLKTGMLLHLIHGTARVAARLALLEQDDIARGGRAIAQLRLESPLLTFLGDRFVVRDPAEQRTLAGGIVLDPDADRDAFRSPVQRKLLTARATAPEAIDVCVLSEIARYGPMASSQLLRKSLFSGQEIEAELECERSRGEIVICGEIAADNQAWRMLENRAADLIDAAHKTKPERGGLDLSDLRVALRDVDSDVFASLLSDLCSNGFVRTGSIIARKSHQPVLPHHLETVAAAIRRTLSENPADPPPRKQIVSNDAARQALRFLIEQGHVIEIGKDLVLSREAFAEMKGNIIAFISANGPATVSSLRQALQTSRRTIVPFLERLDRDRVTQRVGDRRIVIEKL